jgi:hypothetical protein
MIKKQIFKEDEQIIQNVILNNGVLYYLDKGVLISPIFKEGLFGNVLFSHWFDFQEKKIKLGKFYNLNEIKIIESNNLI